MKALFFGVFLSPFASGANLQAVGSGSSRTDTSAKAPSKEHFLGSVRKALVDSLKEDHGEDAAPAGDIADTAIWGGLCELVFNDPAACQICTDEFAELYPAILKSARRDVVAGVLEHDKNKPPSLVVYACEKPFGSADRLSLGHACHALCGGCSEKLSESAPEVLPLKKELTEKRKLRDVALEKIQEINRSLEAEKRFRGTRRGRSRYNS